MDSDEENIVNMGKEEDVKKPATKTPIGHEDIPQFALVRRSQRLSNISRNKSDISAKGRDTSVDF